jgi:hypothetical protein
MRTSPYFQCTIYINHEASSRRREVLCSWGDVAHGDPFYRSTLLLVEVLILSSVLVLPPALAGEPLRLHPANPHYFLFRGSPTVLVTSGEHYGAVLNLDFDYIRYLDELQSNGLNLTRTWPGASYLEVPGSFEIFKNTLAPLPDRFSCIWQRSSSSGYAGGGNKFDLNSWDQAHLARLKDFVAQAGKRGVIVELSLFCPFYNEDLWNVSPWNARNNINGFGDLPRTETMTLKNGKLLAVQEALVRKIVSELKSLTTSTTRSATSRILVGSRWTGSITLPRPL